MGFIVFGVAFVLLGAYCALWPVPEIIFTLLRMEPAASWWREWMFKGTDISLRGATYLIWTVMGLPFGGLCMAFGYLLITHGVGQ